MTGGRKEAAYGMNGGTSVKVSASALPDKRSGGKILTAAVKTAVALCGCLGSVFTFLTAMDMEADRAVTTAAAALCCLYFTISFSCPHKAGWILSLAGAAVIVSVTYVLRDTICAGAAGTVDAFLARVRAEYRDTPFIGTAGTVDTEHCISVFICCASAVMSALASFFTVRAGSAAGVCLTTCVPVFSVLMFGLEPDVTAFFAVVVSWAGMFALEAGNAAGIRDARYGKYSACCGLYAALLSALCIAGVILLAELTGYERPERLNSVYDSAVEYVRGGGVRKKIDEIVTVVTRNSSPSGAIDHGRLGGNDEITFSGMTVLEVTVPKSDETVYLRGFIGSVYTGDSWEELPARKLSELEELTSSFENEGLSPLLLDGYNLKYAKADLPEYSFSVKNISADRGRLYLPYNLVPESVSRYSAGDSGFTGTGELCIGQVYDPDGYYEYRNIFRKRWSAPSALSEDETAYRQFVYENYLDIPESFSTDGIFDESYYGYISAETEITGKSALDEMTVFSRKLYYIKKWLRDNCEYSLKTEKLKSGEDFVDKFLEDKKGSCSHFASAAVIMCRYAGIPARYVEGYVIKPSDFPADAAAGSTVTVHVTDARGHAWVEIYLDGFGWYPMDFTPGYGNVRTALPTETAAEPEPEPVTETEPEPEDVPAPETAVPETETRPLETTVTEQEAEVSLTTAPETAAPDVTGSEPETGTEREPSVGFTVFGMDGGDKVDIRYDLTLPLILLVIIAAVPAVLILRRKIVLAGRRAAAARDPKAGAASDYRRFGRLLRLMELPEQGDMSFGEYAEKLAESSEILSGGEAERIIGLALKASFGGDALTRRDAEELRFEVNSLAKRCRGGLTRFGRFRLKYLYCLL